MRRTGILACRILHREIGTIISREGMTSCEMIPFPCDCSVESHPTILLDDLVRDAADRFDAVVVIGKPCFSKNVRSDPGLCARNVALIERGFDLFLPQPLVHRFLSEGAFIITPGWLDRWKERIGAAWGFDASGSRSFFAESCSRFVLLDTGTCPDCAARLAECAAYAERPFEIVPVGLDMPALLLKNALLERLPSVREEECAEAVSRAADYAMLLDMMSRLVEFTAEEDVASAFIELFDMLCAPSLQMFVPFSGGLAGAPIISPPGALPPEGALERLLAVEGGVFVVGIGQRIRPAPSDGAGDDGLPSRRGTGSSQAHGALLQPRPDRPAHSFAGRCQHAELPKPGADERIACRIRTAGERDGAPGRSRQ